MKTAQLIGCIFLLTGCKPITENTITKIKIFEIENNVKLLNTILNTNDLSSIVYELKEYDFVFQFDSHKNELTTSKNELYLKDLFYKELDKDTKDIMYKLINTFY